MAVTKQNASATRSPDDASTESNRSLRLKIDKSGLYDLMQVKRLLDDEVIAVRKPPPPPTVRASARPAIYRCLELDVLTSVPPLPTSALRAAKPVLKK